MTKYQRPFLYLLLSFTLLACNHSADDPKTVADKYWQYLQSGNISEAEKLITINSRQNFSSHSNRIDASTQLQNGETKTIVTTTITTINPDNKYSHTETFETVLVLEEGQWKVDVNQSQIPPAATAKEQEMQQLTDELSESMQENIESIDEAITHGMQMLNEALHEGSKEMGDSMLNMLNELNSSMHESIDKMKQRRQQQLQEQHEKDQQKPQPQPDPRQGEGMI
jgi:hypothetical protein